MIPRQRMIPVDANSPPVNLMQRSPVLPPAVLRNCPACGTDPVAPLYHQRFRAPEEGGLLAGYGVHACLACGLGFASPIPSQADFDAYYARLSKYEQNSTPSAFDVTRYRRMASLLREKRGTTGRVLDIGCASGSMIQSLLEQGFTEVEGLEPSPLAAEQARAKGLSVSEGSMWSLNEGTGHWDLILLTAVLEHLRDLDEAMSIFNSLLSANGQIFLQLPDASRFPDAIDAPFQEFSLEHINYFGPLGLQALMAKHGFRLVHLEQGFVETPTHQRLPELIALFERSSEPSPRLPKDDVTAEALARYVSISSRREHELGQRLEILAASQQPILVWGVGTLTQHLLETTALSRCHITAFLDGNPRYHGLQMAGRPILAPSSAADHPEQILIGSYQFHTEIERTLRQTLGLANPVIRLYPVT